MAKALKSFAALQEQITADLQSNKLDLHLTISSVAQAEIRPRSKFDVVEEVRPEEDQIKLSPDVRTPDEADQALEEETKGTRPYATTTFLLKNKAFLVGKLVERGIQGVD
jgi:hypothetical protein